MKNPLGFPVVSVPDERRTLSLIAIWRFLERRHESERQTAKRLIRRLRQQEGDVELPDESLPALQPQRRERRPLRLGEVSKPGFEVHPANRSTFRFAHGRSTPPTAESVSTQ